MHVSILVTMVLILGYSKLIFYIPIHDHMEENLHVKPRKIPQTESF